MRRARTASPVPRMVLRVTSMICGLVGLALVASNAQAQDAGLEEAAPGDLPWANPIGEGGHLDCDNVPLPGERSCLCLFGVDFYDSGTLDADPADGQMTLPGPGKQQLVGYMVICINW